MVDASRECTRVRRPALGSLPRHDPNRWTAIVLPKDVVGAVHSNFEAFASGSPILQVLSVVPVRVVKVRGNVCTMSCNATYHQTIAL